MPAITFNRLRKTALAIAVAIAAPLLAVSGQPAAGQAAPALVAASFSGAAIDLQALRGKAVLLNFWASWCQPCRQEMPLLESLSREYRDRLVVLGLSADDPHDRKDAVAIAGAVSYPTGLLAEAHTNGFGMPPVLPLTYVIGSSGRIHAVLLPGRAALTEAQLRSVIEAALQEGAGR